MIKLKELIKKYLFKNDKHEMNYMIGLAAINAMRNRYERINDIREVDLKVYSQYGEDGIIDFIMNKLGVIKPTFVEIGTEDYSESNTRFLFQRTNTKGLIIDCDNQLEPKVKKVLGNYYWKGNITTKSCFVTRDNIIDLLELENQKWTQTDLFSLDIDGNDYWIMKEILKSCKYKVIVLEFNPYFGSSEEITVPYDETFYRTDYHYSNLCWGASLKAFIKLLELYNYIFIGTNLNSNNGFWVREDLIHKLGINLPDTEKLEEWTKNYCRESRNKEGKLNYIDEDNRLKSIRHCRVVNLAKGEKIETIETIYNLRE